MCCSSSRSCAPLSPARHSSSSPTPISFRQSVPGQVLQDIIDSGAIPVASLKTVYRQGSGSSIITNAHRINSGELPDLSNAEGSDFFFFGARDAESARDLVVDIVATRLPNKFGLDPLRDVQVLAPMRKGPAGVDELNALLQAKLNPARPAPGRTFARGDKLMQTVNNYDKEVFNGDVGIVREISPDGETVLMEFDRALIEYNGRDVDQLKLAYATTVHKAQGSEFPAVVIPLMSGHSIMLQRNLLYTAVTRASKYVILVGEKKAVARAVHNPNASRRWTRLKACLGGERGRGRRPGGLRRASCERRDGGHMAGDMVDTCQCAALPQPTEWPRGGQTPLTPA